MASFTVVDSLRDDLADGRHNFASDTLRWALTDTAPVVTDTVWSASAFPPPAAANGYPAGGGAITVTSSSQTSGTYKLIIEDFTFTATAGGIGPFRYMVMYNDTSASNLLIGYADYGSELTLGNGETLLLDASAANGILQIV